VIRIRVVAHQKPRQAPKDNTNTSQSLQLSSCALCSSKRSNGRPHQSKRHQGQGIGRFFFLIDFLRFFFLRPILKKTPSLTTLFPLPLVATTKTPWGRFEDALRKEGTSFDEIKALTNEEDIKQLIREYGFERIKDIAKILTEFKKRQGGVFFICLLRLKQISPSCLKKKKKHL
jgi:hypothetical protein